MFPRWDLVVTGVYPTIPGDHVPACVTDSQGVPPATPLASAIEQTTDAGSSHNTSQFVLDDLLKCDKTRCHDIFVDQMVHIFQYGMKDILETLSALDMDVLSTINSTLAERAKVKTGVVYRGLWHTQLQRTFGISDLVSLMAPLQRSWTRYFPKIDQLILIPLSSKKTHRSA